MSENSIEPEPRRISCQAQGLVDRLRRAVDAGEPDTALALLARIEALAQAHPSWSSPLDCQVMALGSLGPLAGMGGVPTIEALAQTVEQLCEPWLAADLDGFMDVFQDARHAALHGLMHAAARGGAINLALDLCRRNDAANMRVEARWRSENIPSSPGTHASYPSAYAATQMIPYLIEADRYDAVPPLLDRLQELTGHGLTDPDDTNELCDALGDEEANALAMLLAAATLPEPLRTRCLARQDALARVAQPPEDWPRTWSHLPRLRLIG